MLRFQLLACALSLLATSCVGSAAHAFGALAVDGNRGARYGFSYNFPKVEDARARALKECGAGCTVTHTFKNTCAALAADQSRPNGATGWGYAPTAEEAQQTATNFCKKFGGKWCLVRVWACETVTTRGSDAQLTYERAPPLEQVAAVPPSNQPNSPIEQAPPTQPPPVPANASGAPASTPAPPEPAKLDQKGILEIWVRANEAVNARQDQKVTVYLKSKALVIGNDAYEQGWPTLSNGVKDAEEIAKGLEAQGFEVTLKKNLKSDDLDRTLKDFFIYQGLEPNSRLLVWFAGHGHTIDGEGYIVPVDAPAAKSDAAFRDKALSLRRFGEYMREARSRHVLAIFDSCFSGTVFNLARSAPPPAITLATTQPVREFISSGEADQQVSDDGTFRKLFLDALAGKEPDADANHDGYLTGTELGLFLQQKLTNLTDNRQTPRYGKLNALGYDRGDFVFQVEKLQADDLTGASPGRRQP